MKTILHFVLICAVVAMIEGCASGYKGPIQTADGQKMEEPDYNY